MRIELLSLAISGLTFIVIAVTAVAATVQLRHMRANNELSALMTLLDDWKGDDLQGWFRFVRIELPERLRDPSFLDDLRRPAVDRAVHPELNMCDFWEQVGTYVRFGLITKEPLLSIAGYTVKNIYESVQPCIEAIRESEGDSLYENFELLAALGALYQHRYRDGRYPSDVPRYRALPAKVREPLDAAAS
jgi:hypothetical protein